MHAAAVKAQALIRGGLAEGPQLGRVSEEMVMIWWVDQYLLIPFLHPFTSYFGVHQGYQGFDPSPYGGWKKSCTTLALGCYFNPINNGINHLSTGAGFLPSTEIHQIYPNILRFS